MSLTIELSPEAERQLRRVAAREGQEPEQLVRSLVEDRLAQERSGTGLAALMDRWLDEGPDLEEADGYPDQIERLRLREPDGE
jgi:predicted transcriptional regulator